MESENRRAVRAAVMARHDSGVSSLVGREPSVQGVLIPGDRADALTKVGICQRLQSCSTSCRLTCSALEREASG